MNTAAKRSLTAADMARISRVSIKLKETNMKTFATALALTLLMGLAVGCEEPGNTTPDNPPATDPSAEEPAGGVGGVDIDAGEGGVDVEVGGEGGVDVEVGDGDEVDGATEPNQ